MLGSKAFYGYRKIARELKATHRHLTSKRVRRIMHQLGLCAIYPTLNSSRPRKGHKKYLYLLREKEIRHTNQVWATDVTYLRLPSGFVYLTAVMNLFSRKVLSWRLSNSMDATFCGAALREAIDRYGVPAIFNTERFHQGLDYATPETMHKSFVLEESLPLAG